MDHVKRVKALYKIVMRLHRGLPSDLRLLGDKYAKDEFKRHKKCNPSEANVFMHEWTKYAVMLSQQLSSKDNLRSKRDFGDSLDVDVLDNLSDGQIMQLYELMKASGYANE